ncbi:LapA family protein [Candidatus Kaiserbacteria bacterium]|nr:LapA family protein [Candidatus Kaiserbacteria bacterium]
MTFTLVLGALLGAFAVVFAMDNSALVTVHLLSWEVTAPLAIILMSAVVLGILVVLIAMIPRAIQRTMEEYAVRREKRKVELAMVREQSQAV